MASEAKLKANERYLKTKETFVIRVDKALKDEIDQYTESIGTTRNAYIVKLIKDDLSKRPLTPMREKE